MRKITFSILLVVMLVTFGAYATAVDIPQQQPRVEMKAMSVAELEKAGDEARGQKNYSLAIDYFQAALKKDRRNANLYNKLGLAQLKNNELNAAKTSFQKASKIQLEVRRGHQQHRRRGVHAERTMAARPNISRRLSPWMSPIPLTT